ncbi:hypothetical protein AB0I72_19050 [Nocardiopsis sp. NPDC049922]|uniref:hypothetical protein n=1 Tax=Nocardiopsis sp. NPDC049922 TaxID=3155157 RepID=UPI0033C8B6D2
MNARTLADMVGAALIQPLDATADEPELRAVHAVLARAVAARTRHHVRVRPVPELVDLTATGDYADLPAHWLVVDSSTDGVLGRVGQHESGRWYTVVGAGHDGPDVGRAADAIRWVATHSCDARPRGHPCGQPYGHHGEHVPSPGRWAR